MNGLGGHIGRKKSKEKHHSLGLVSRSELAQSAPTPAQNDSAPAEGTKPQVKDKKPAGEKTPGLPPTSTRHPSLSFRLWYCTCEMTTKAVEKTPAGTTEAAWTGTAEAAGTVSAETNEAVGKVKEESADTPGWVYRCSCGKEYEQEERLGGHLTHYRDDKANHKNLGSGPPSESADTTEPAELYVSDKDKGIAKGKDKGKGKRPAGEKGNRITTNIDEAASIAVAPKEFKTSSILLWQAQKVSENRWNWPKIDYRLGTRPNLSGRLLFYSS